MWTYYKQDLARDLWTVFRRNEANAEQVFNRQKGWMATNELSLRRFKGEIDSADMVTEEEAFRLIRSIGMDPDAAAPPR